jgi:transposase
MIQRKTSLRFAPHATQSCIGELIEDCILTGPRATLRDHLKTGGYYPPKDKGDAMNPFQAIKPEQKCAVKQFEREFPSEDACLEYVKERRFPGRVAFCVNCKVDRKHYRVAGRTSYACHACGNHIYSPAGTIFHKPTTRLRTWFFVIRLVASTRVGVSAKPIQRETGVTYKTAWRIMKQIRKLMAEKLALVGHVEMDEAHFGGADSNKPKHLRGSRRGTILGMVEGGGCVVAQVVPDVTTSSLVPIVRETIQPGSLASSDEAPACRIAVYDHFTHMTVNHSRGYMYGYTRTNTIDGFWSLVKRGITGVYYQVGLPYLQSYLDEYAFRYTRRKIMRPMFSLLAERTTTKGCPSARERRLLARTEQSQPCPRDHGRLCGWERGWVSSYQFPLDK